MEEIRRAIEKASGYLAENPDAATATDAAATAVREEGLRFRVDGPKGSLSSDMSESVGGGGSAPTPGWLLRAALTLDSPMNVRGRHAWLWLFRCAMTRDRVMEHAWDAARL